MKRLFAVFMIVLLLAGCSSPNSPDDVDILEIGERFFVTQIEQIFIDTETYLGRTIRYEGMFFSSHWEGEDFHYVIRHTFGCCGDDGMIGFEVMLNGIEPFPDDTWVEVTGVLEEYNLDWRTILVINAISVTEMPERGLEFVEN